MGFGNSGFGKNMQEFAAVHGALTRCLTRKLQLRSQHLRRAHQLHFRRLFIGQTAASLRQQHSAIRRITLAMKIVDFGPLGIGEMPA